MRRVMLGMSQEKLGEALGLTFQQVQKYEKGTNRIGASRLQQISRILDVPPAFFFDGAPAFEGMPRPNAPVIPTGDEASLSYVTEFLATPEGLHLNLAFRRIKDPKVRKRIVELVMAIAGDEEQLLSPVPSVGPGFSEG